MLAQQPDALGELLASCVTTMPPSPAPPRFFEGKNEKQPKSLIEPERFPSHSEPMDWAASSIRKAWCRSQTALMAGHVAALAVERDGDHRLGARA